MGTTTNDSCHAFGMRKQVDFSHLMFEPELVKHLRLFGLESLKPFQYIMGKCLIDALECMDRSNKASASKFVFYNDGGSGRSVGYILPLLQIYSRNKGADPNSAKPFQGSTLIVAKDTESSRDIGCLIISLNPNVNCLVLDDAGSSEIANAGIERQCNPLVGDEIRKAAHNISASKELSGSCVTNEVLVVSISRLRALLASKSKGFSPARLSTISCIIFDDFSRYISGGDVLEDLYNRIKSARLMEASDSDTGKHGAIMPRPGVKDRPPKKIADAVAREHIDPTSMAAGLTDVHIVAIVDSIGDVFCKYATEHLGGFWLYDFKDGTKRRIIGDGRNDAVRLEVDLNITPEIVTVSSEGPPTGTNLPIEHSICKVVGGNKKWDRIYTLKCLVYYYLNLPTISLERLLPPMIRKPRPSHQCIIFVSNRAQQRYLSSLECFRDISVYLGRDITIYERATNLSRFRNGSRPIMIATDASIKGCNFDDVRYIFNYHPPRTVESYRCRAAIAGKNANSLCISMYSKDEYSAFSTLLKDLGRRISIHIPPSRDFMLQHNVSWLESFASELVKAKPSFLLPFITKAAELLETQGSDAIFNKCISLLVGDDSIRHATGEASGLSPIKDGSILSGRRGYTAVTVFDGGAYGSMSMNDLKRLVQRLLPDISVESILGKYCRTENGYVIDVATDSVGALLNAANDEPDVYFETAHHLPRMVLDVSTRHQRARGHMNKLPWRSYKIRRLQQQRRMI
ncbi:hypothetical protein X943_002582 [Babesia divergens]|uniref:ATP-dependent RNA helicase n=1 Tax=Babesia divergens TaxID=32595 RepID=A0AAD9GDE2_BABDI|nr:hypothetical protein X943_002582 [Babesia divergens]